MNRKHTALAAMIATATAAICASPANAYFFPLPPIPVIVLPPVAVLPNPPEVDPPVVVPPPTVIPPGGGTPPPTTNTPEPATLLMGLSAAGLAGLVARRRKA